jgi:ABC-type Fe3+ transport system substrate-binding protein
MSPHRDEIKEETARGFQEWFAERTQTRAAAARTSLQAWSQRSVPDLRQTASQAFAELFRDWRREDLADLHDAFRTWDNDPSPEHSASLLAALQQWQEHIPSLDIVWQDIGGGTSQIARYIAARFESNPQGIGIDILFGGGTDIFYRFADQGLLQKLQFSQELLGSRIPPKLQNGVPLYDPDGRWFGPVVTSFGILYNREVLKRIGQPQPRTWSDLGTPGMYGWVSAADPRMTGSVHMVYEIILQGRGWSEGFRLLMRLGANSHTFIRDSGTLTRTVATAEVAAASNLDANALSAVGRDPEGMGFVLPAGETSINADAIAVLKGAPRTELARAFVEYTLSDAGQLLFLLRPGQPGGPRRHPLCRLSVVEALYTRYPPEARSVGAANPFAIGSTVSYDSKLGNSRWDALNDLFGAVILDVHPDLTAAWKALIHSPKSAAERERLERELFTTPITEEELKAHARNITAGNPRVRTATINRWGEQARKHYRDIRKHAEEDR